MSDWEDDEWDEDALEEKMAQNEKKKANGSEDESDEEAPAKPKAEPAAKGKFKPPARKGGEEEEEVIVETKTVTKNSLEELEINLQTHVDQLVKMVVPKLENAEAKSAPNKFLLDVFKGLQVKLTVGEMEPLERLCKDMYLKKKKAEKEAEGKKKDEEDKKKKDKLGANLDVADDDFFASMM